VNRLDASHNEMSSPYHIFSTRDNEYIYSTLSNDIVLIDDLTSKIINSIFRENKQFGQTIDALKKDHNLENIVNSCSLVKKLTSNKIISENNKINLLKPELPKKPYSSTLVIGLTEQCNFRCLYCSYSGNYLGQREHSNLKIDLDTSLDTINQLADMQNQKIHIGFYGGEPLIEYKKIRDIVAYSKKKFDKTTYSITTNASLLKKDKISFLIDNDFITVISLDGPKNMHDKWRRTISNDETFEKIIPKLELIKDLNSEYYEKKVGFNCVLTPPYEFFKIEEFFNTELFKKNQVNFIQVNMYDSKLKFKELDENSSRQLEILKEKYIQDLIENRPEERPKIVSSIYEKPIKQIFDRVKNPLLKFPINGPCLPGIHKLYLNSSGIYQICERSVQTLSIGDIRNGIDFKKSDKILSDYHDFVRDKCKDCWSSRLCGLCEVSPLKNNVYDKERLDEQCDIMRNTLHNSLIMYARVIEKNPNAFISLFKQ